MRFLVLFIAVFLFAANEDFLKTLNEVSEIATESKLNIDKTPSNVDVINREFIVNSGAKTLLDVLKYIPSVEISMTPSGKKQLIIRGSKFAFRDKIKLLINGVEVTNNLYNNQFYYYNFPASLIKRVEFTKTPDAILYGENAFLGVLNVITLDEYSDNLFSVYGSTQNEFQFAFFKKSGHLLSDGFYSYSYPDIYSPPVYKIDVVNKTSEIFRDDVKINSLEKNLGLGLRYLKGNSQLSFRFNYYKKGNFFGIENIPPLKRDKTVEFYHTYLEYRYSKYLRYNLKEEFRTGVKNYIWDGAYRVYPYDLNSTSPDVIAGAKIPEYQIYLKNLIKYDTPKHNINFIIDLKYAKPYDYYYYEYVEGLTPKNESSGLFLQKVSRKSIGSGIEDLYILKDNLSLIAGYRIDKYNDFGINHSYKFGGVYNISSNTTFKILYNNAFRVPSWIELYAKTLGAFNGNPDLKPEKISMCEFILIKSFKNDKLKMTFYKGINKNFIGRGVEPDSGKLVYQNLGDYDIKGIEISYKKLFKKFQYYLSYSLNENKAKLNQSSQFVYDYQGIRKRWLKGWGVYKVDSKNRIFISCLYGSKINLPEGYATSIGNYFELNSNYIYQKENVKFIFGVNNITNHKNYMPDFPSDLINNRYLFVYKDAKLPFTGRKFFMKVSVKW